jgi:hypothetical protein
VVDSGRYLGVPTRGASLPDLNPAEGFPTKVEAVSHPARGPSPQALPDAYQREFSVNLDFPLLSVLVKQQCSQKFLFPPPVLRVDTDAFGAPSPRPETASGPSTAHVPVGLLHFQLVTWPSRFVTGLRAVRLAWRLVHQSWTGPVTRSAWLQKGGLGWVQEPYLPLRAREVPGGHRGRVRPTGVVSGTRSAPRATTPTPSSASCGGVRHAAAGFVTSSHTSTSLTGVAPKVHVRPCVPSTREDTRKVVASNEVAPFLRESGDVARAAFRLQAPVLASDPFLHQRCASCAGRSPSPLRIS